MPTFFCPAGTFLDQSCPTIGNPTVSDCCKDCPPPFDPDLAVPGINSISDCPCQAGYYLEVGSISRFPPNGGQCTPCPDPVEFTLVFPGATDPS